jgi:hypothetical protein
MPRLRDASANPPGGGRLKVDLGRFDARSVERYRRIGVNEEAGQELQRVFQGVLWSPELTILQALHEPEISRGARSQWEARIVGRAQIYPRDRHWVGRRRRDRRTQNGQGRDEATPTLCATGR